jgi:hypothetical protein
MLKTIIKTSLVILLLGFLPPTQAAGSSSMAGLLNISNGMTWDAVATELPHFSLKRGVPYDESKDPALRRGSENSEQPDNSFFIIPIVMFVGMGLFLFYTKL